MKKTTQIKKNEGQIWPFGFSCVTWEPNFQLPFMDLNQTLMHHLLQFLKQPLETGFKREKVPIDFF